MHVQNIAPRRPCSRRTNTGVDTCDGVALGTSGLDRVDRDGQQDQDASDVVGTHLEQWHEGKFFLKSLNCAIVARTTTLQETAIVPCRWAWPELSKVFRNTSVDVCERVFC